MEKYIKALINTASKLDALTDASGEITRLASEIIGKTDDDKSTIALLKQIYSIADSDEYSKEIKQIAAMLKNSIISYYGYGKLLEICNKEKQNKEDKDKRSLSELLEEFNALVGLESVKEKVSDLIAYQKVQKLRRENNLFSYKNTLHLAFTGNPGTGKTTVARIIGRIYKQIGLLSKGHFVEVSRTDLIAGYQGQTALKVKKVIEKAKGGVLFIDEAYSITENDHADSYGRECLTELTKALEDYRDDLVVIVAGYTEPMKKFFESNPGLKSRFNTFIEFEDYSAYELEEILENMCSLNDYELSDDARKLLQEYFIKKVETKEDNFANGRMVRNLFDDLVMNHARRVIKLDAPNKSDLRTILSVDFIPDLKGKKDVDDD